MVDSNLLKLSVLGIAAVVVLKMAAPTYDTYDTYDNQDTYDTYETYDTAQPSTTQGPTVGLASDLVASPPMAFDQFVPDPDVLTGKNFLDGRRWTSVNTIGGSLRNANRQLRSDPPVPRISGVTPWMQSTIDEDLLRRPLE